MWGILEKTAKNSKKKNRQKPCFFYLNCCEYGFASLPSPQKRNFMSEMMVSTNILLINGKKCMESWKKAAKTRKKTAKENRHKPCFFVINCWKYVFASFSSAQQGSYMSEMIVSTNILPINAKKCVESWKEKIKNSK